METEMVNLRALTQRNRRRAPSWRALVRCVKCTCAVLLVSLSACVRVPPQTPLDAFREISPPLLHDDHNLEGLAEAINAQLAVLKRTPDTIMQFGPEARTREEYAAALDQLLQNLRAERSLTDKLTYIREHFRFFEWFGDQEWGRVLLTSYFEPVIPGSRSRTPRFSRALMRKPDNLLTIPLAQFSERFSHEKPLKGRLLNSKVVPYYTREEIDGKAALQNKGLELAWTDPVDGFFLQIQGSGTVRYDDGSEEYIVYADKNGHKYEAIGKFLRERIAPKPITMQRIEAILRGMSPRERDTILFRNPSYVFFSKSSQRAITALGVPATPGRTIATDPRLAPKGAVAFLEFLKPTFNSGTLEDQQEPSFIPSSRFVVDQDTGGAITGTGRVDLFWGRGDDAKRFAGVQQHPARIVYLVPR